MVNSWKKKRNYSAILNKQNLTKQSLKFLCNKITRKMNNKKSTLRKCFWTQNLKEMKELVSILKIRKLLLVFRKEKFHKAQATV